MERKLTIPDGAWPAKTWSGLKSTVIKSVRTTFQEMRAWRRPLFFCLLAGICLYVILWFPEKLVDYYGRYAHNQPPMSREVYTKAVDDYRKTFSQIMAGLGGFYALYLLLRRTRATEQMLQATLEGQITERFTKAIEQLGATDKDGKKVLEIRFGGIYALERIARDSARDHGPVMEILSAYVRHHARWIERPDVVGQDTPIPELDKDIQAAITVIGRRDVKQDGNGVIDLTGVDLRGVSLERAHLGSALLRGAHLDEANLMFADLRKADLAGASLRKANFCLAYLWDARLNGAHLEGANLNGARMERAQLAGAHLEGVTGHAQLEEANLELAFLQGANLEGSDLRKAWMAGANLEGTNLKTAHLEATQFRYMSTSSIGLTPEQVRMAYIDQTTILPFDRSLLNSEDDRLIAELTKRGIHESMARAVLVHLPADQAVLDQLEWGDYQINQGREKIPNPVLFYLSLLKQNVVPPPTFETSAANDAVPPVLIVSKEPPHPNDAAQGRT